MQTELAEKTIVVDLKTKDCGEMLETISVNTKEATGGKSCLLKEQSREHAWHVPRL